MKWRRTEVTIETQQRLILRKTPSLLARRCEQCAVESTMISPEDAALICGSGTRAIYRWLETETIHFVETSRGTVHICLNSLLQAHNTARVATAADVRGHSTA